MIIPGLSSGNNVRVCSLFIENHVRVPTNEGRNPSVGLTCDAGPTLNPHLVAASATHATNNHLLSTAGQTDYAAGQKM